VTRSVVQPVGRAQLAQQDTSAALA
jgi:hypothetical protein